MTLLPPETLDIRDRHSFDAEVGERAVVAEGQPVKPGDGALKIDDLQVKVDPQAEWKQIGVTLKIVHHGGSRPALEGDLSPRSFRPADYQRFQPRTSAGAYR